MARIGGFGGEAKEVVTSEEFKFHLECEGIEKETVAVLVGSG